MKIVRFLGLLIFSFSSAAFAFNHNDWELVCTNTGTCKAAGYSAEYWDDEQEISYLSASILLTRKAGANQLVSGQVQFEYSDDSAWFDEIGTINFFINGQNLGLVKIDSQGKAFLTEKQVAALLSTVKKTARIEFKSEAEQWRVSDNGLTAVLLKMDEQQGRTGTVGALVSKGKKNEHEVLKERPKLRVKAEKIAFYKTIEASDKAFSKFNSAIGSDGGDEKLCFSGSNTPVDCPISIYKLSNNKLLLIQQAWRGAYNEGSNALIIDELLTEQGQLISDSINHVAEKEGLFAGHKGRGVGDCWSYEQWVWDGQAMVKVSSGHTGMCKGMIGGFWPTELNTIEAEITQ